MYMHAYQLDQVMYMNVQVSTHMLISLVWPDDFRRTGNQTPQKYMLIASIGNTHRLTVLYW